ncbi:hypothetical protein NL676_008978 [Syzygium grande]|nr:hypothetical protein NL676_008978 [Syzygium grande]
MKKISNCYISPEVGFFTFSSSSPTAPHANCSRSILSRSAPSPGLVLTVPLPILVAPHPSLRASAHRPPLYLLSRVPSSSSFKSFGAALALVHIFFNAI